MNFISIEQAEVVLNRLRAKNKKNSRRMTLSKNIVYGERMIISIG